MANRKSVVVSSRAITAWAEPQFVISHRGKYYVTGAVLEYDPATKEGDFRSGTALVRKAFENGDRVDAVVITDSKSFIELAAVQTVVPPKPPR
jgi:hypothetical protein